MQDCIINTCPADTFSGGVVVELLGLFSGGVLQRPRFFDRFPVGVSTGSMPNQM